MFERHDANERNHPEVMVNATNLRTGACVRDVMSTVARLSNCKIKVYGWPREHGAPHFHLEGPDSYCKLDAATLEVIAGPKFSRKDLSEAKNWMSEPANFAIFIAEWRRLNEREE